MGQTPAEYWQNNQSLQNITPAGIEFPEIGLPAAVKEACTGSVFEFGCGYGRLAGFFDPDWYYGYDINPAAIEAARKRNPAHSFGSEMRGAYTFLAYTVLLHVPDDEIEAVIEAAKADYQRIVIGEIMGREWRRPGNPPVFNRGAEEYVQMVDWQHRIIKVSYPRYGCDLDLMVFDK